MAIKEMPSRYEYTCDKSGQSQSLPRNTDRPQGWACFILERGAQDFGGAEVADASVRRLFCGRCTSSLIEVMNTWVTADDKKKED